MKINDILVEFAPAGGGGSGNYFQELASAWYNGTFDSGSLQKGIKSQQDVERLLQRGIVGPDGVTRKYAIDYNSDFDGVVISSDDYYEHSDYDEQGQEVDSRTGQKWGPYDYMEFSDEDLSEGINEFVTPQAVAQDPGLEREKDVDVIFFGRPGKDYNAEDAWAALEEVLPAEYPPGSEKAQYKVAEVAKSGGAVVTTKPLSVAKQLVSTFNGYGIKSRVNGNLNEFAPDSNDGGEDDALRNYARMWWGGDEATQMQIERALAKMGWEIGEDEGGYDNGGVFVVRAGDINGDSYTSWAAEDLTEGLTEVDRRGFLKGLGAAAVAGAAGGVATKADAQEITQWTKYATDLATRTVGRIHQDTGYDLRNWLVVNVGNWVSDYCTKTNSYNAKNVIDYCNQQGYEASGLDKENKLVTAFLTNMKNRYQDFLNAYRAGISESFQKFNAAVQKQQNTPPIFTKPYATLNLTLACYYYAKEFDQSKVPALQEALSRYIKATNEKDLVNSSYQLLKAELEKIKESEPQRYKDIGSNYLSNSQQYIDNLGKISSSKEPEFKESVEQGVAEGDLNEKSTSQAQFRTMAAAAHDPKFAKKVGIKQSVAREFNRADKGQDYKDLPKKATEGAPVTTTPGSIEPGGAVDNFKQQMANNTEIAYQKGMAEGNRKPEPPEADYGDDYQDMVKRVKKLAGLGPLKTQYDPAKRVYRNMPTAVQPKK